MRTNLVKREMRGMKDAETKEKRREWVPKVKSMSENKEK